MTPGKRLIRFLCLLLLLAGGTLWITRECQLPHQSVQETGLQWLKEEYHLDEETFRKVEALHLSYFATCDKMCRQIEEADRPLSRRARTRQTPPGPNWLRQEQRLCDECENAAKNHLKQVAALLPEGQRQRFLDHMLETLEAQRRIHDLEVSARTRS